MFVKDHEHLFTNSLPPCGGMGADWVPEAFEDNFAQVFELESFADA